MRVALLLLIISSLMSWASDSSSSLSDSTPKILRLGIVPRDIDEALRAQLRLAPKEGLLVFALAPNGPALKYGVEKNDVLLKVGKHDIAVKRDLLLALQDAKAGEELLVLVLRAGERKELKIKLEEGFFIAERMGQRVREPANMNEAIARNVGAGAKPPAISDELKALISSQAKELFQELAKTDVALDPMDAVVKLQALRNLAQSAGSTPKDQGEWMPGKAGAAKIRVQDVQGFIEIEGFNNMIKINVYDVDSKLISSYSYGTAEERKKVPQEMRKRIAALSFDFN